MKLLSIVLSFSITVLFIMGFNWLVWLAYTHFQVKFGWYPLSYWELFAAIFLINLVLTWFRKSN